MGQGNLTMVAKDWTKRMGNYGVNLRGLRWMLVPFALAVATAGSASSNEAVSEAQEVIRRYVDARQAISRELQRWQEQELLLTQTVDLLEQELELLAARSKEYEEVATKADLERSELDAENQALLDLSDKIRQRLIPLEIRVKELGKGFAAPLRKTLEPVFARMPEDPEATQASLGSRLQNLVAILTEADRFNGRVTLVAEIRDTRDGRVEVQTLYLGLGGALFVDAAASTAGVGHPGPDGWTWEEKPQLADTIRQAVSMYRNEQQADFVRLPLVFN